MDDRICRVLDYIEDHLFENLDLNDMAGKACMSPGHFHKIFKKETDRTPFAFTLEIRMNRAFQLLVDGSELISDLSLQLGYNDYETFSRAFKKYHGLAPDDLKAIAQRIKEDADVEPANMIIKTVEVEDTSNEDKMLDQLSSDVKKMWDELTEEEKRDARILTITPKSKQSDIGETMVKNKFVIAENQRLWQKLLEQTYDGRN